MATGGEVTYIINSDDKDFTRAIDSADSKMGAFDKKSRNVGGFVKGLFTYDMIKGAVTGMADLVSNTISYTGALEQSQIAWNTLLGSQEAAEEMQKNLQNLAKETPFDYAGVDKMAKSLSMAGFEGQDLLDAVVSVGDAVSAVGGNTDTATSATRALYQMYSKGKVQAEEMMQLSEAGIPVWQILAKETGKSVAELQEMGSAGQLLAEDVLPMLVKGMGTEFAGAMEDQSQSFNGLMATFQDQLGMVGSWLTTPLFDALKTGLSGLTGWVDGILDIIQTEGASRPEMWNAIKDYLFDTIKNMTGGGGIKTKIVEMLTGIVQSIQENAPQLIESGGTMIANLITGMLNYLPIYYESLGTLITTVLTLITDNLPLILEQGSKILTALVDGIFQNLPKILDVVFQIITTLATALVENWPTILQNGVDLLLNLIDGIIQALPAVGESVLQIISSFVSGVVENLPTIIAQGVEMLTSLVSGIAERLPEIASIALDIITKFIQIIVDNLPGIISAGVDIVLSLVDGLIDMYGDLGSAVNEIVDIVIDTVTGIDLFEIGVNIVKGLWDGISSVADWIGDKIGGFVDGVTDDIKDFLGIASPSKLMADEVGQWLPKGLAVGIDDNASSAIRAMENMNKKVQMSAEGVVTPYSKDIAAVKGAAVATGNTFHFYQTNNSPDPIDAREAARLARINAQRLGYELQGG